MAHSEFQLEDLRDALASEKASKQLCSISDDFYKAMRNYLTELREEVEDMGMAAGTKATRLQRQYQRANNHAEDLFNRRAQKIVLSAVHRLGGERADLENMTSKEKELYHELEGLLKETKDEIFEGGYERQPSSESAEGGDAEEDTKSTEKDSVSTEREGSAEKAEQGSKEKEIKEKVERIREEERSNRTAEEEGKESGNKEKGGTEPEEEVIPERKIKKTSSEKETNNEEVEERTVEKAGQNQNKKREKGAPLQDHHLKVGDPKGSKQKEILIRVTDKIEPFVDLHGSYDLEEEDVVTLKKEIADLLVEQGKAKKIKLD